MSTLPSLRPQSLRNAALRTAGLLIVLIGGPAGAQVNDNPFDTKPATPPSTAKPMNDDPFADDLVQPSTAPGDKMPAEITKSDADPLTPSEATTSPVDPEKIKELMTAGNYAEAAKLLEASIKHNPSDVVALAQLGVMYRMLNRLDDSIASLTAAIKLAPEEAELYVRRAVVWFLKGEYGVAMGDIDQAGSLNISDPRPELWRGLVLVKQNRIRDAVSAYSAALRLENSYTMARTNRGLAFAAIGEYESALADFNDLIRNDPTDATAYCKRAAVQSRLGEVSQAIASYSDAIRLDAKYAEAYYNRGLLYQRAGQGDKARADREQALQLNPKIDSLVQTSTSLPLMTQRK